MRNRIAWIFAVAFAKACLILSPAGCSYESAADKALRHKVESLEIAVDQCDWKANKLKEVALDHEKEFGKVYDQMGEILKIQTKANSLFEVPREGVPPNPMLPQTGPTTITRFGE